MPINSGVYIITNVKQGNLVFLENPDYNTPLRGHYRKNIPSELWRVTRLENGYHLIWNVAYERYANCGSRAGLDAYVEGHDMEQQWRLQEHSTGKYTIATTDNRSLWMLPDSELFTPVGLSKVPTDRTCWWTFADPEAEAPVNGNDAIQTVIFEMKQLPITPFSPLIMDLVIIQEISDDSISKASTAVSKIYNPLILSGRVQPDAFRINITEFKAFGSKNVSFQRFSDFVTFERLRNVQWLRCGGSRWVESGISGLRVDATKVIILNFSAISLPHSGKVIVELITHLDIHLVLTLIQPDLEDALYDSDIFRELGELAFGSMPHLYQGGFSDYVVNYNETVALPRLAQDEELRNTTIRHLLEAFNDEGHGPWSGAGTVLSKLAGHAELRASMFSALLVEMIKNNSSEVEFVASALVKLAEHPDLCEAACLAIPRITDMLKDKSHGKRSAAVTVLSKLAEHAELRDLIFAGLLKIVEMLKDTSDGAEFAASTMIELVEDPRLCAIGTIYRDNSGRTSLSWAAENGLDGVVRLLLTHVDINVNAKDNYSWTPLLWAAREGHDGVVRMLLGHQGVDINTANNRGETPLWLAACKRHDAVIHRLMAHPHVDVNSKDNCGQTPLSWAAQEGNDEVVGLLLAHQGIDVNGEDNQGHTPLWSAAFKRHHSAISLLLAHPCIDVNAKDRHGQTTLSWAAQEGHDRVISLLLTHQNIEVNTKNEEGQTPLWLAACKGRGEVIRLLLAHRHIDVNAKDAKYGRSPLSEAAQKGKDDVVRQLLARPSVEIDARDHRGQTPLLWAAREGHSGTIRLLLGYHGISADIKDDEGWTPLLWAAREGHDEVVRLLLDHQGIDANTIGNRGETPLWLAVCKKHDTVIRRLLAHSSVNVNAKDDHGQTPLSWAAQEGNNEAVGLLLAHRDIDVDAKDNQGRTPLKLAAKNGHKMVVGMLRGKAHQMKSGSRSRLLSRLSPTS